MECNRVNIKSPHTHTSTDASTCAYAVPYMWVQRIHWSKDNKRKTEKKGYYFKMFKILLFFILHSRILTKDLAGKKVKMKNNPTHLRGLESCFLSLLLLLNLEVVCMRVNHLDSWECRLDDLLDLPEVLSETKPKTLRCCWFHAHPIATCWQEPTSLPPQCQLRRIGLP